MRGRYLLCPRAVLIPAPWPQGTCVAGLLRAQGCAPGSAAGYSVSGLTYLWRIRS